MLEGPDMTNIYIIERLNLGNTSEILFDTAEYFINVSLQNHEDAIYYEDLYFSLAFLNSSKFYCRVVNPITPFNTWKITVSN